MIGYDISDEYVQISYYHPERLEPESISSAVGNEKFQIPLVLCKETNSNTWYYGDEAVKMSLRGKGILVEDLLRNAVNEKTIKLGGKEYRYLELLILFIRKTINLISMVTDKEALGTIIFTVGNLDGRKKYILGKLISEIGLASTKFSILTYEESFYYYMIHQRKELWNQEVVLFYWQEKELSVFHLETNHKVTPKLVSVSRNQYDTSELLKELSDKLSVDEKYKKYDEIFTKVIKGQLQKRNVSSVYLIGDFYSGGWMKDSLKLLCQGRRVFQGNNLFTKGACYGALKIEKNTGNMKNSKEEIVFLSPEGKKTKDLEKMINCSSESQKTKLLGDYYLSRNLYHKAIMEYEKIVKYQEKGYDLDSLGAVWNNLGVCYGKLFLFSKALQSFLYSYKIKLNSETGYNAACMMKLLEDEESDLSFLNEEEKELLITINQKFEESVVELFDKEIIESKKAIIHIAENERRNGKIGKSYEMLEGLLLEWKEEYRSFVNEKN